MSRMSHGSPVVGSSVLTFCSSEANFISSSMSRLLFSFSPSVPSAHDHAALAVVADAGGTRRQLHVGARAVRHRRAGLRQHLDLAIVEPHGVGDDGRRTEDAALVHLLDRAPAELAQALLDLPDRLRRVGVDAGAELLGQRCRAAEHLRRAVEDVLQPDPRAHAAVGGDEVRLQQAAVRLQRLEVVVAIGAVRRQRRPDADVVGRLAPSPP